MRDIEQQCCTHVTCLGDIVGYFDQPKQCLDIIRGMNIPCLKGNHDEYASSETQLTGFSPDAERAVSWTREQLTENDKLWLRELPYSLVLSGFTIVHATMDHPELWGYVFDKLAAEAHFEHQLTPVCFFGHTHVPVAFVRDSVVRGGTFSTFKVEPRKQYNVNVGSVGQPRDHSPKAAYVTYDLDSCLIELRRLDYPTSEVGGAGGATSPTPGSTGPSSPPSRHAANS